MAGTNQPIVIRKIVEEGGHGHHGGAWKVAYADFVTAMMAFFLLLWLISSANKATLEGLSRYFSESDLNVGTPGGSGGLLDGITLTPGQSAPQAPISPFQMSVTVPTADTEQPPSFELDLSRPEGEAGDSTADSDRLLAAERERREQESFDRAKAAILNTIAATPELEKFKDQLVIDETPEGLRIQLIDREHSAMFPAGGARMYPHTRKLLRLVAQAIKGLPNKISIRGHTDATPFAARSGYDNWKLSTDRANATREELARLGLEPQRIAEVVGKADTEPFITEDPRDPRNRRISIVLLHAGQSAGTASGHEAEATSAGSEKPGRVPFGAETPAGAKTPAAAAAPPTSRLPAATATSPATGAPPADGAH